MLEGMGVQLALSSGKPCAHLAGCCGRRLPEVIMMGENGAVTQFGIDLPPRKQYRLAEALRLRNTWPGLKASLSSGSARCPGFSRARLC